VTLFTVEKLNLSDKGLEICANAEWQRTCLISWRRCYFVTCFWCFCGCVFQNSMRHFWSLTMTRSADDLAKQPQAVSFIALHSCIQLCAYMYTVEGLQPFFKDPHIAIMMMMMMPFWMTEISQL